MSQESESEQGAAPWSRGSRRWRVAFFAVNGVLLTGTLLLFRGVLIPFLLAIVLAYVFAPLVRGLEWAMPRWVAVVVLYAGLLGAATALVAVGAPRIAVEVEKLAAEGPSLVRKVREEWLPTMEREFRQAMASYQVEHAAPQPAPSRAGEPEEPAHGFDAGVPSAGSDSIVVLPSRAGGYSVHLPPSGITVHAEGEGAFRIGSQPRHGGPREDVTATLTDALRKQTENTQSYAVTLLRTVQTVAQAVVRGIFTFFIMLMISAYLLITSDQIFDFLRSLVRPGKEMQFDRLLQRIDRGLSGVVRGQLLIALVNGVLSGIGFYILDLKYWHILTLVATVLSIIPIFGAIISSVPAVLIGIQNGPATALLVLAWIVGIHQLEANVLNPKIMGDAAKVHPVLVVFALLAGEHIFGIVGALLAVPVLSIVQSLFLHFREIALGLRARAAPTSAAAGSD